MNITDVKIPEKSTMVGNSLKVIFKEQERLLEKYRVIEKMPKKFSFQSYETQEIIKQMVQRVHEESMEAYETVEDGKIFSSTTHFEEEFVGDVMHFFVEMLIVSGIGYKSLPKIESFSRAAPFSHGSGRKLKLFIKDRIFMLLYHLGLACNTLKSKKWKQSQVISDEKKFGSYVLDAYVVYIQTLVDLGYSPSGILEIYLKKKEVNKFRLRSKY